MLIILSKKSLFNKSKVVQLCLYSYRQWYSSLQWSKCCPQQISTTLMTNIVVNKSTDKAEPLLISFLPQYSMPKKEQALSITFLQCDWFISQNERSWLAITLHDKLACAWHEQHCLDSYRQQQISQSDCEITNNYCGKIIITLQMYWSGACFQKEAGSW